MNNRLFTLMIYFDPAFSDDPMEVDFDTGRELISFVDGLSLGRSSGKHIVRLESIEPKTTIVPLPEEVDT